MVLVAHCILNQNSISDGTAGFPATFKDVIALLLEYDVGVVQLPCPELACLGLDRGDVHGAERPVIIENSRIRESLSQTGPTEKLKAIVDQVIYQIEEYRKHDFFLLGIIGINRSPSCGVETTSMNNEEVPGMGLFMEAVRRELSAREIHIDMIGVKTSEIERSFLKTKGLLDGRFEKN